MVVGVIHYFTNKIMLLLARKKEWTKLLVLRIVGLPIIGRLTNTDSMAATVMVFSFPSSTNCAFRTDRSRTVGNAVKIWIEPAEEGFVDEEENLEEGERCLVSVKAFASHTAGSSSSIGGDATDEDANDGHDDGYDPLFLCAGALVRRPCEKDRASSSSISICDAWMGGAAATTSTTDSVGSGPNLEIQGAIQVLDHLLLHHLKATHE